MAPTVRPIEKPRRRPDQGLNPKPYALHLTHIPRTCGDVSAQVCLFRSSTRSFSAIDACVSACCSGVIFAGASLNARPFDVSISIFTRPGAPDSAHFLEEGGSVHREAALVAPNLAGQGGTANPAAPESERRIARVRIMPPCTCILGVGHAWVARGVNCLGHSATVTHAIERHCDPRN